MLQGAQRDGLFRRVLGVGVRLRHVRQDHLRVRLRAERPRFEQGLAKPDATGVDIHARLHIVQRVHHGVQAGPKVVIERPVLGLLADANLQSLDLERRVHLLHGPGRGGGLRLADVVLPEQELTVQVRDLDPVHVRHRDFPAAPAASAEHRERLQVLAAQRSGANEEKLQLAEALLEGPAEDGNLVVVAPAHRLAVRRRRLGLLQQLEHVQVQQLPQGRVLACELHDLLGDDAAEEGRHGCDHARRK
mmetsp:Transcript_76380/g.220748  ORF Transcript_76380/g.220748 Transcript_76380/m.220748 type:complete len:247 (+) Transcript_76380:1263-2003(+)